MKIDKHTDELILAYLRGDIPQDDSDRLAELLRSDSSARERFTMLARQEVQLRTLLQRQAEDPLPIPQQEHKRLAFPVRSLLAVAAALVLCAGAYLLWNTSDSVPIGPMAVRVSELRGEAIARNGDRITPLRTGSIVPWGTSIETTTGSYLEVVTQDGDVIDMDADTNLRLEQAENTPGMILGKGNIYCNIRKTGQPRQFEIATESGHKAVVPGTRFEMRSKGRKTTVAVEEGVVILKTLSHNETLKALRVGTADGDNITQGEYIMTYELAAWKFRPDDVPAGTVLFKEDFGSGSPRINLIDIKATSSENQGIGGSRCLQYVSRPTSRKDNTAGLFAPQLFLRHKNFDITFSYRWKGPSSWRHGPLVGHGTSVDEEFSWRHPQESGEEAWASATIVGESNLRRAPANEWLDILLQQRSSNSTYRIYYKGELCYERKSITVTPIASMGFIFGGDTKQGVAAYIDNLVVKKASESLAPR
ncbi:MAG: hypothetical protein C0404_01845 [Verrucomicrobia bacterium]|nr:hypothetical protein [Verrucomicrobiota bacterium]